MYMALQAPEVYTLEHLPKIRSIIEFDDHYTARLFGFGLPGGEAKSEALLCNKAG